MLCTMLCIMLCYVMYYVMLCYAMLCYVLLCIMLCYAMYCYVMYYVMSCYVKLCYVKLCHVMLCYVSVMSYASELVLCEVIFVLFYVTQHEIQQSSKGQERVLKCTFIFSVQNGPNEHISVLGSLCCGYISFPGPVLEFGYISLPRQSLFFTKQDQFATSI